ncbi:NAD(P)/FAD-dependent oxidoreductase [uncultured Draconibacterium sp.]|uniref:NAD(P)/FAD-dependent oxidoreductase n=1 Tax=uncultured Draconibacterium sp. TaxID=1573823 RepID=UPI003216F9AC
MNKFDVIVVGAGPAGLLAAGRAAELGAKVLILEKMRSEGRKLLITGKGRCNVTNSAGISEFIPHVFPNGRFLKNAFSQYFSKDIIELLEKYKVELTLERGGRYFPTSQKAMDILQALLKWVNELGVTIQCGMRVEKLLVNEGQIQGVRAGGEEFFAGKVIVATGGKSYPATGSTGDGYELARQVGHSIEKPIPALVPVETKGGVAQKLQGLNLKNVNAVVWVDGKKAGEAFGEMLFTHFGLSGPIILTLSRIMVKALQNDQQVEVTVDLKPALDEQKLDTRLQRDLNEHGKKQLSNIFKNWLPSSMIPVFIEELALDEDKECHQVSGKERKQIRHMMKNMRFEVSHNRSFKEAIITAGGIVTSEIRPKTMESKLVTGLYFAGEIIDVDAETGGYNLQIAYSTGWVAGNSWQSGS